MSRLKLEDFKTLCKRKNDLPVNNIKIVLDSSAWLRFYNYNSTLRKKIYKALENNSDLFWIPNEVWKEINRNNIKVKNSGPSEAKEEKENIKNEIVNLQDKTKKRIDFIEKYGFTEINEVGELIENNLNSIIKELNKHKLPSGKSMLYNILELIEDEMIQTGEEYDFPELLDLYKEGQFRYEYNLPPGFKDRNKSKKKNVKTEEMHSDELVHKYSDFIIWKQVLDKFYATDTIIIFVTSDFKEDFWEKNNNQIIDGRKELYSEFKSYSNGKLYFLPDNEFYFFLKELNSESTDSNKFTFFFDQYIEETILKYSILENLTKQIQKQIEFEDNYETEFIREDYDINELKSIEIQPIEEHMIEIDFSDFQHYIQDENARAEGSLNCKIGCVIDYLDFDEDNKSNFAFMNFRVSIELLFDLNDLVNNFEKLLPKIEVTSLILQSIEVD